MNHKTTKRQRRLHFDTGHPTGIGYSTRTACGRRIVNNIIERLHGLQGGMRQRLTTQIKAHATCKRCRDWRGTRARSQLQLLHILTKATDRTNRRLQHSDDQHLPKAASLHRQALTTESRIRRLLNNSRP